MCKCLFISESGYYRWLKNKSKPSSRQLLSVEIQKIIDEHPDNDNYGVLRMRIALEQNGITVSKRTVSRTMSEMGLLHKRREPHGQCLYLNDIDLYLFHFFVYPSIVS